MALVPYASPTDIKEHQRKQYPRYRGLYEDAQLDWSRRFLSCSETRHTEPLIWHVTRYDSEQGVIHFEFHRNLTIVSSPSPIARGIQRWYESMRSRPGPRRQLFSM